METRRWATAAMVSLSYTAIDAARKLMLESLSLSEAAFTLLGSLALGIYLVWLQDRVRLKRSSLTFLLWVNLFIVGSFNNMLEGYFFTSVFDSFSMFAIWGLRSCWCPVAFRRRPWGTCFSQVNDP